MQARALAGLVTLSLLAAAPGCKSSQKPPPSVAAEGLNSDQVAFLRAAARGKPGVAEEFLGAVDINVRDADGRTALYLAAAGGHDAMVAWLASKGADLNAKETIKGWTPMHAAAAAGHDDVITVLAGRGADLEPKDKDGATPLNLAQRARHAVAAQAIYDAQNAGRDGANNPR